jgi:hypothetical protein
MQTDKKKSANRTFCLASEIEIRFEIRPPIFLFVLFRYFLIFENQKQPNRNILLLK